jgi:hypothetical protein
MTIPPIRSRYQMSTQLGGIYVTFEIHFSLSSHQIGVHQANKNQVSCGFIVEMRLPEDQNTHIPAVLDLRGDNHSVNIELSIVL